MTRMATFQFRLDPTVAQAGVLSRHVGAARFAFNQCLRLHLDARRSGGEARVPRSGFDLINAFNAWKRSPAAGRRFVVGSDRTTTEQVTGLSWRREVLAQVFEEAAVDLGRGLKASSDSRAGTRKGPKVGFPRFKKKQQSRGAFRIRAMTSRTGRCTVRVGSDDGTVPRAVVLPKIGLIRVRESTRRLRRMIATGRAKVLRATIRRGARGNWSIALTVQAADLHPARRHPHRDVGADRDQSGGWVGVDRGLKTMVVAATGDGTEVLRTASTAAPLARSLRALRRASKDVSRKQKGSRNRYRAVARLARVHERVRHRRQHVLHQVSNQLVKTHDRLALEDLNIPGMLANRRLARAISDAGWGGLARQITYKQAWRGGQVAIVDRWYPSSKTCSACQSVKPTLSLNERVFVCPSCGHTMDRDLNAATNLATWAGKHATAAKDVSAGNAARTTEPIRA